jgi:hypothetical protein
MEPPVRRETQTAPVIPAIPHGRDGSNVRRLVR